MSLAAQGGWLFEMNQQTHQFAPVGIRVFLEGTDFFKSDLFRFFL